VDDAMSERRKMNRAEEDALRLFNYHKERVARLEEELRDAREDMESADREYIRCRRAANMQYAPTTGSTGETK
jgi:hypothetical protein